MRIIRTVLVYLLVRSVVVSAIGLAALYSFAGHDSVSRIGVMLRDGPQAALMKVAEVLGR